MVSHVVNWRPFRRILYNINFGMFMCCVAIHQANRQKTPTRKRLNNNDNIEFIFAAGIARAVPAKMEINRFERRRWEAIRWLK